MTAHERSRNNKTVVAQGFLARVLFLSGIAAESQTVARRINGRFAKGYSGNPAGHPTVNEIDRRKRVDAAGSGRQYTPGQNGDGMDVDWNDDKQATAAYRAEKKSKIVSEQHNAGQLQADAPRWSS